MDATSSTTTPAGTARWQRRVAWTFRGLLIAVCLIAAGLTVLPAALGFQRFVVTGSSMNGTIGKGSVVFDRAVATSSLKVGDVITYQPPAGSNVPGNRMTDRIVSITTGVDGRPIFETKGDSSATNDPWQFYLANTKQAKVAVHIPFVGTPLAFLASRGVRIGVIAGIIVLIALRIAIGLFIGGEERTGRHVAEQESELQSETDGSAVPAALESLDDGEVRDDVLGATRAAALAALIAASSAAAGSRGLTEIHGIPEQEIRTSSRAAS
jgi:signal peptidase